MAEDLHRNDSFANVSLSEDDGNLLSRLAEPSKYELENTDWMVYLELHPVLLYPVLLCHVSERVQVANFSSVMYSLASHQAIYDEIEEKERENMALKKKVSCVIVLCFFVCTILPFLLVNTLPKSDMKLGVNSDAWNCRIKCFHSFYSRLTSFIHFKPWHMFQIEEMSAAVNENRSLRDDNDVLRVSACRSLCSCVTFMFSNSTS